MKPHEIEELSFKIIDTEAGAHPYNSASWSIVRRMIHTSADFEYTTAARISPTAVQAGIQALRSGKNIITDTHMALSGIRKKSVEKFGGRAFCLMADPEVAASAKEKGITRAREAVDRAAQAMEGGIYVIGNAPTALLRLMELVDQGRANPALVIGLPVGFVKAAESKALLVETRIPHISNHGRKGGSNIAAAVVNALIILAEEQSL